MRDFLKQTNSPVKEIPPDYCPVDDSKFFTIKRGKDKGKMIFYRDSNILGTDPEECIVFVHGNPESSYTYRKIIKELSEQVQFPCRIIAMDHIGFGLSDQATYQMVSMDHAENLLQLVRKLDLHRVTLVVHDWGGPIGIGAFLKDPERIENLVLLNTTVFPIPKSGITFQNYPIPWLGWAIAPKIIPDRFWGNFASYAIYANPIEPIALLTNMVKYIILSELDIYPNDHEIARKFYKGQFNSLQNTLSSKRLVKQTKYWGRGNKFRDPKLGIRDTRPFYQFIINNLSNMWGTDGNKINVKAIIGRWDPLGQNSVLRQWITALPQLKNNVDIFKNIGHFIEERVPKFIARKILSLLYK